MSHPDNITCLIFTAWQPHWSYTVWRFISSKIGQNLMQCLHRAEVEKLSIVDMWCHPDTLVFIWDSLLTSLMFQRSGVDQSDTLCLAQFSAGSYCWDTDLGDIFCQDGLKIWIFYFVPKITPVFTWSVCIRESTDAVNVCSHLLYFSQHTKPWKCKLFGRWLHQNSEQRHSCFCQ